MWHRVQLEVDMRRRRLDIEIRCLLLKLEAFEKKLFPPTQHLITFVENGKKAVA